MLHIRAKEKNMFLFQINSFERGIQGHLRISFASILLHSFVFSDFNIFVR